ncbi:GNAT family N-acetyltransferase [Legionella fallonii]|uniref:Acetyltransferase, GNAT family n=1 Tax=Legionella fallonii LLAP-10 TaxID=1212491 RepID=A0A098G973_9GAMM|nr:GNAT family N-acetyltransferase [Legionella fallonii]CEG58554.1 Acetyltransferase, GNAT family [Legionella fallonii LLAP-10]
MIPRRAHTTDINIINTLIRESKGHWGYTETFLDEFMKQWGIKEHYIHTNEVVLLEKEKELISLFAFKINEEQLPELDLFFVHRNQIGKGIGKIMWQHVMHYAVEQNWTEFKIIADPHAEQFYQYMGAKNIGVFESFPGRFVPAMMFQLPHLDGYANA